MVKIVWKSADEVFKGWKIMKKPEPRKILKLEKWCRKLCIRENFLSWKSSLKKNGNTLSLFNKNSTRLDRSNNDRTLCDVLISLSATTTAGLLKVRIMFYGSKWSWKIVNYEYTSQISYLVPKSEIFLHLWNEKFSYEKSCTEKGCLLFNGTMIYFTDYK